MNTAWGKTELCPLFNGRVVVTALFIDVPDVPDLISRIPEQDLTPCPHALVDAQTLMSKRHLLHGVLRAIGNETSKKMVTRSLSSEILYSLSANKNISEALKFFGVREDTKAFAVALIDPTDDQVLTFEEAVGGRLVELSDEYLSSFSLTDKIQNHAKILPEEIALRGGLEAAILTRIASKAI
eukprot:Polyplicarium_translucidae@DN551_c0_g1_i1.p1